MVPRIGGSQHLKRTAVVPLEGSSRRKNSSRASALKPPVPPPETEEDTKKVGEGDKHVTKKVPEEENVIKVEKKGLLGQVQSFFAWISAWPSIPEKVLLISITTIKFKRGS